MLIRTKLLGEIEIQETDVILFKEGLPGFPEYKKYTLIGLDPDLPIAMLQSTEEVDINFVIAFPFAFNKEYSFELTEQDKEDLKIIKELDIVTYSIVTLKDTFQESTLNLLAPVVINLNQKLGKQVVLNDSERYPLQYKIGVPAGSEV